MHNSYGSYRAVSGIATIKPGESGGHNRTLRVSSQQSAGHYELILNRHRASSFIVTSNRAMDEWLGLFKGPIVGNSALIRLTKSSSRVAANGNASLRIVPCWAQAGKEVIYR